MNPRRYLTPAMTAQRRKAMAWIMAHRLTRKTCLTLARLQDTPQAITRAWNSGDLPAAIAQTSIAASIGLAFGCMFGLAF